LIISIGGIKVFLSPSLHCLTLIFYGQPFFFPEANRAFIEALKMNLPSRIPVIERDMHINDTSFTREVAQALLKLLGE